MLSLVEKILFILVSAVSFYLTYRGVMRIIRHISSGQGRPDWQLIWKRLGEVIVKAGLFGSVFRFRFVISIFHAMIGWSFITLAVTDLLDPIYALTGIRVLDRLGLLGHLYQSFADIATSAVLVGITFMVIRRFIVRPSNLSTRESTLLLQSARAGIKRDSFFVASFIIVCNVARLLTNSFYLAGAGEPNAWEPVRVLLRLEAELGAEQARGLVAVAVVGIPEIE